MSTPKRSFKESAKRVGPAVMLAAGVGLAFYARLSTPAMVAIFVICVPVLAMRRKRKSGGFEPVAPASVEKPNALSGSPVALATIGLAIKLSSVRFGGESFDLVGTTLLVLATFLTGWLAWKRLVFQHRRARDVVMDVLFGASGWAVIAVAGVLTAVVAKPRGVVLMAAGATALSCVVGSAFRLPLVPTQNQRLRLGQRRAASRP